MPEAKRVIVVGATGEIGRAISAKLLSDPAYALVVFSRDPEAARQKVPGAVDYIAWEPAETGQWAAAVDGAYAVINMAGAPSIGVRWTSAYRAFLHTNRTTILRGLVRAMEDAATSGGLCRRVGRRCLRLHQQGPSGSHRGNSRR
jgi:uncharacterized protein